MFEVNKTYQGFAYLGSKPATNVKGVAHMFKHEVTEALVCYIETKTDKKCFNISFRTPAHDDTGVTHILEHSVLEGSKKYPASEALFHLEKHSICDEVNAYTCNESTVFHFSSRNEKDFNILFDYYMDGVMHPSVLEDPGIFLQEGWHLENAGKGKVKASGVVYNEMKAHMLNRICIEYGVALSNIFPGTCYDYEAGGDICAIPTLTYDKAKEYYKKYYHPSNSVTVLYGDLDIEYYLKALNEEFFTGYSFRSYKFKNYKTKRQSQRSTFSGCKPITTPKALREELNDVWLTYGDYDGLSRKDSILVHLLLAYFMSYNEHKVRYRMLTGKFCEEMNLFMQDAMPGSCYGVIFENCPIESKDSCVEAFVAIAQQIVEEGIDYRNMKILIKALKSSYLKSCVDEDYTDEVNAKLLRGQDPFSESIKECFEEFEDKLENDIEYFSEAIDRFFVHAKSYDISIFTPDPTYKARLKAELDDVLNPKKEKWSKEELERIKTTEQALANRLYASEPKVCEHLELTKEDINTAVEWNECHKMPILGKDVNCYVIPDSDIAYINIDLDISNLSVKETAILEALKDYLFCNYTKNRSNAQTSYEMAYFFEDYSANIAYENRVKEDKLKRTLELRFEIKNENIEKAIELLSDIFVNTTYGHRVSTYGLLYWSMIDNFGATYERPETVAPMMARSPFSKADNVKYRTRGLASSTYLIQLLTESGTADGMTKLARKCQLIYSKVFNISRMSMFIAGSEDVILDVADLLDTGLKDMPSTLSEFDSCYIPVTRGYYNVSSAASIESLVQYNALSIDVSDELKNFKGSPEVICSFLQEWIVHKLIREKGNAYGSSVRFQDGIFTFTSYRDPKVTNTLDVFASVGKIMDSIDIVDFEKHKIARAGRKNMFRTEIDKIEAIEGYMRQGKTEEDMKKDADKILDTTEEDLRECCKALTKAVCDKKYSYFCIGDIDNLRKTRKDVLDKIYVF